MDSNFFSEYWGRISLVIFFILINVFVSIKYKDERFRDRLATRFLFNIYGAFLYVMFVLAFMFIETKTTATVIVIKPNYEHTSFSCKDTYRDYKGRLHKLEPNKMYVDNMTDTGLVIWGITYSRFHAVYSPDKLVDQIPSNGFSEIEKSPDFYWEAPEKIKVRRGHAVKYLLAK